MSVATAPVSGESSARLPLAGLVVIDFGQIFQGPYATFLLAKGGGPPASLPATAPAAPSAASNCRPRPSDNKKTQVGVTRNGSMIRNRPSITSPCCMSSDQSLSQPARRAEAAIIAS